MNRIVLDQRMLPGKEIEISGPPLEALCFLGARRGSLVTLTDAEGKDFRGRVVRLTPAGATLFVFEVFPSSTESPLEIFLLQALPEKERMEWIIQKTTELGVSVIIPFESERSISLEEREAKQKKAHRWQHIAVKAVQQSRRARVPRIEASSSLHEAVERHAGEGLRLILWEKAGEPLREVLIRNPSRRVFAMVGPEGGFSEPEVEWSKGKGFIPIQLGQRILRTETAAVTLVGILQYELGDLGS